MQRSTVFLLIVALASAGVSFGFWQELRAERALNAELSERLAALTSIPIAPEPVSNPPVDPSPVVAPVAATAALSTVSTPVSAAVEIATPKSPQAGQEDWQTRQRKMMSDPKYRQAFLEQQRLRLATRRDNLIRLLGLSADQADAVIDLSIERQMNVMNLSAGGPEQHGDNSEGAYQEKLRALLGEEKSAQLQTYMESRPTRMQVDQFRIQLSGADMLRDDQVEPLIAALHVERSQMQRELQEFASTTNQDFDPRGTHRKYSDRETELLKEAYGRMRSSAAAILSSTQLQKLDAMLKRDIERREMQQQMSRIQSKLEPAPEAPGGSN